jgi:dolichol-phosphate mannosyltransferase
MDITFATPFYNEEEGIGNYYSCVMPVIRRLRKTRSVEMVLVDDGSTDNTHKALIKRFSGLPFVRVIRHPVNKNLGGAMRTIFRESKGRYLYTYEADCTFAPELVFDMLSLAEKTGAGIICSSPYAVGGKLVGVPAYRQFLSRAVIFLYRLIMNSKLSGFTPMVRLYSRKAYRDRKLLPKRKSFVSISEVLCYALINGYRVKEIPITLKARQFGQSSARVLSLTLDHISFLAGLFPRVFLRRRGQGA